MRTVDQLFARYAGYHRHPLNKAIHWVCVPLIVWSLLGMLWCASPIVAWIAIVAALAFYAWLSIPLALGMAGVAAAMVAALALLGGHTLIVSEVVFVAAWIGQFVGHALERSRPSFTEDLRAFLVAPAWLLGFVYRRLGIGY
ncbi:MAG TPA: Mpo1-like protein [Casimicrobiaceae bacterium]|nr:Mpo1-like protein [Casimicrobiaceae bacterium]